jgi:hypothetical protein
MRRVVPRSSLVELIERECSFLRTLLLRLRGSTIVARSSSHKGCVKNLDCVAGRIASSRR